MIFSVSTLYRTTFLFAYRKFRLYQSLERVNILSNVTSIKFHSIYPVINIGSNQTLLSYNEIQHIYTPNFQEVHFYLPVRHLSSKNFFSNFSSSLSLSVPSRICSLFRCRALSLSLSLSHSLSLSLSSISSSSILFLVANSRSVCFSTVAQSTVPPTSLASRRFSVFFLAADMPACCFARSPSPSCPFSLFSMHRQQRRGNRVFATHSRGARVQGEWHVHGASLSTS